MLGSLLVGHFPYALTFPSTDEIVQLPVVWGTLGSWGPSDAITNFPEAMVEKFCHIL